MLFGGITSYGVASDVWLYHYNGPPDQFWLPFTPPANQSAPVGRWGHGGATRPPYLVQTESAAFIFGGCNILPPDFYSETFTANNLSMCAMDELWQFCVQCNTPGWTQIKRNSSSSTPWPPARLHHSVATVPDSACMVVFGGYGAHGPLNDTWVFDMNTLTWTELVSPNGLRPAARFGHAGSAANGGIAILGGCNASNPDDCAMPQYQMDYIWHLQLNNTQNCSAGGTWRKSNGIYSLVYGNMIYEPTSQLQVVLSGFNDLGLNPGVSICNFSVPIAQNILVSVSAFTGPPFTVIPPARYGASNLAVMPYTFTPGGALLFLFGGTDTVHFYDDLWIYVPQQSFFNRVTPEQQPQPRLGSPFTYYQGRFFTFGGVGFSYTEYAETWWLDYNASTWRQLQMQTIPPGVNFNTLTNIDDQVLLMFGGTQSGWLETVPTNMLWVMSLLPGNVANWYPAIQTGPALAGHSAHYWVPQKSLVIFGGWTTAFPSQPFEFWRLNYSNSVYTFRWTNLSNLMFGQWTTVNISGPLPTPRSGHAAALFDELSDSPSLVVFGGISKAYIVLDDTWMLRLSPNMSAWTWTQIRPALLGTSNKPSPVLGAAYGRLGPDKLFIYSGYLNYSWTSGDMWLLQRTPSGMQWLLLSTGNPASIASGGAFASGNSSDFYVFAGTGDVESLASADLQLQNTVRKVQLGCPAGMFSADMVNQPCELCPLGTYALNPGSTACTPCPGSTYTAKVGSMQSSDCSVCKPGTCSHGTCVVSGENTVHCHCDLGWSGSLCNVNSLAIALGCVFGALVFAVLALYVQRRLKKRVSFLEMNQSMQERLLADQSTELTRLERIWEISPDDITFKREITEDAQGTFARVWYGEWQGREVAVKVLRESIKELDETAQSKFRDEMKVIRQLRHRNIVFFYGIGVQGEVPFLVFEWMRRGTLEKILKSKSPLSWPRRIGFALDTARGMDYLHQHNPPLLHRDLKSANLLISKDWVAKVSDFGTARQSLYGHWTTHVEERRYTGSVGTIAWTAPEVLSDQYYDTPCDVYSFGIVLWELCTRQMPFENTPNYFALRKAVLEGTRPPIPSWCPPAFATLISQCVAMQPFNRPLFSQLVNTLTLMAAQSATWQEPPGPALDSMSTHSFVFVSNNSIPPDVPPHSSSSAM
eukprot:m.188434 g.188434  ORF g.188434 m.188434 type:complete len:1153 (-) comp17536_c2_seq1:210-3668(-)